MNKRTLVLMAGLAVAGLAAPMAALGSDFFSRMFSHYDAIRRALGAESLKDVPEHARLLAELGRELNAKPEHDGSGVPRERINELALVLSGIDAAATRLAAAGDLATARTAFSELSKEMITYRGLLREDATPVVVYCPMANKSWLQGADEEIGNPYFGQAMARCGQIVSMPSTHDVVRRKF